MPFVKYNKVTKLFSATDFISGNMLFKDLKQIPKEYGRKVIIYYGNGINIHPSHWLDKWFE